MNHKKKNKKLNLPTDQRLALLKGLALNFIKFNKIKTTSVRAKQAKSFIERLITIAKKDTVSSRRLLFSIINNKNFVKELTEKSKAISAKSGYLKITKCGFRRGDSSEISQLELV